MLRDKLVPLEGLVLFMHLPAMPTGTSERILTRGQLHGDPPQFGEFLQPGPAAESGDYTRASTTIACQSLLYYTA